MELPHPEDPEMYEYDDEGWDSDDSRYQESGVTFKSQRIARYILKVVYVLNFNSCHFKRAEKLSQASRVNFF